MWLGAPAVQEVSFLFFFAVQKFSLQQDMFIGEASSPGSRGV
jgi:hypothetical protein